MAQLELLSLQRGAGAGPSTEPAVLALPNRTPRKVLAQFSPAYGESAARIDRDLWRAIDLDPCRFCGRSPGCRGLDCPDPSGLSPTPYRDFFHHRHGPRPRPKALR